MIIKNKTKDMFVNILRIMCLLLIVVLIIFHDWNLNASIIFGLILIFTISLSAKTYTEIKSEEMLIVTKRILPILTKTRIFKKEEILNFEYSPKKKYPLLLILPGIGGLKSAKCKISLSNGKSFEYLSNIKKQDLESIRKELNIK